MKTKVKKTTKHRVTYYYPGSFVANLSNQDIVDRYSIGKIPKGCYGLSVTDFTEVLIDGETIRGKETNESGMVFFGQKMDAEDVKNENDQEGKYDILLSNMRCNDYEFVVKTRSGWFQPVREGDVVLPADASSMQVWDVLEAMDAAKLAEAKP